MIVKGAAKTRPAKNSSVGLISINPKISHGFWLIPKYSHPRILPITPAGIPKNRGKNIQTSTDRVKVNFIFRLSGVMGEIL